jgi:NAD(P)-dependent dehydrogenase (short-subunit alcohol dehydrogenase family)
MEVSKKIAIVTGASSGIGKAAAEVLAQNGFIVYGTSRKASPGERHGKVQLLKLDVTDDASVQSVVDAIIKRHGRIDVLVNNAGLGLSGAAEESSTEQAQTVFNVNFFGALRMIRAVVPHMRAQGDGRIINVSSVLGFIPSPYMALYGATKFAIEGYSDSLSHELREFGIRIALIEPGYTKTSLDLNSMEADRPLSAYAKQNSNFDDVLKAGMARGDEPEVVGKAILAAATDATPRFRYPVGSATRLVGRLQRFAPHSVFDKQIRKFNKLPA